MPGKARGAGHDRKEKEMSVLACQINLCVMRTPWLLAAVTDYEFSGLSVDAVLGWLTWAVQIYGGILTVFGVIGVANAFKDGQGMAMDANVGKLVGGLGVLAASMLFKLL